MFLALVAWLLGARRGFVVPLVASALRSSVSAWLWSGGDAPTPSGDALAGYFVGEAVKVYCPQYSYLLTS